MDQSAQRETSCESYTRGLTCVLVNENIVPVTPTNLRAIREGKGVSLRALKKISGVAVATLARIEAGDYDPRLSTLRRIANALGVTVAELIGEIRWKGGR